MSIVNDGSIILMTFTHTCLNCDNEFQDNFPERLFCSQNCLEEYNQDMLLEAAN
jgi:hypothetical protein